jgi:hypothetical protein
MRYLSGVGVAAISLLSCSPEVRAGAIAECAAALKTDVTIMQSNYAAQVAYLDTINKDNYEEAKHNGSLSVMIEDLPIGASYSDFTKYREKFERSVNLT